MILGLVLGIIFIIIINDNYKKLKHYESIIEYYKWNEYLNKTPPHSGKYLLQYSVKDNNENHLIVTYYNMRKKEWILPYNSEPIAWCHLPNYLYSNKKG